MGLSIQDYAKKINSSLSRGTVLSLLLTTLFMVGFAFFLDFQKRASIVPVVYSEATEGGSGDVLGDTADSRPFASKNGKTYTFSWCGSTNILEKNKIYFQNEAQAVASGRTLSKLCQK